MVEKDSLYCAHHVPHPTPTHPCVPLDPIVQRSFPPRRGSKGMTADTLPNPKNSETVHANSPSKGSEELSLKRNETQATVRFIFVLRIQALLTQTTPLLTADPSFLTHFQSSPTMRAVSAHTHGNGSTAARSIGHGTSGDVGLVILAARQRHVVILKLRIHWAG